MIRQNAITSVLVFMALTAAATLGVTAVRRYAIPGGSDRPGADDPYTPGLLSLSWTRSASSSYDCFQFELHWDEKHSRFLLDAVCTTPKGKTIRVTDRRIDTGRCIKEIIEPIEQAELSLYQAEEPEFMVLDEDFESLCLGYQDRESARYELPPEETREAMRSFLEEAAEH